MIELSNNEAATLIKLAARGVRYPWGLSEEAAHAVHWLIDRQLPVLELFSVLFAWADEREFSTLILQPDKTPWQSSRNELCPLVCGAAIIDTASSLLSVNSITLNKVVCPMLLLPFLSEASQVLEKPIRVSCNNASLRLRGNRIELPDNSNEMLSNRILKASTESVSFSIADDFIEQHNHPISAEAATSDSEFSELWPKVVYNRVSAELNFLESLKQYAYRTYAPASEQSRLSGAGAGTSDND